MASHSPHRRGPLGSLDLAIAGPALGIAEDSLRTLIDVKGARGTELPSHGVGQFVWNLGPDWWMVDAPAEGHDLLESPTAVEIRRQVADQVSVVDVSCHRTTFVLRGSDALAVMAHGCALDLQQVPVGGSVQGILAQTQVVIGRVAEDAWRVYPRASFARHLARWLTDASVEYVAL